MKIMAREYETASKTPSTSIVLKVIGTFDFIGVYLYFLTQRPVFVALLGDLGGIFCIALGLIISATASALFFALAEIITYLHAIRWNTDGYTVKRGRSIDDQPDDSEGI